MSAVEVYGPNGQMRDLLVDYAKEDQQHPTPIVDVVHDAVLGTQLNNVQELRVHTPEKAAFYLDAALATRNYRKSPFSIHQHSLCCRYE